MANLSRIKAVGFDLDGVVYFGSKAASGAVEIIRALRSRGYTVFFMTNNSARTREEIASKLNSLGIAARKDDIFTSGSTCAAFLARFRHSRILVLGSDGLKKEFLRLGLKIVSRPKCDFLVMGYDSKFDYAKIALGLAALQGRAKFIACNLDRNFPGENGRLFPACAAMVGAVAAASGRDPDLVIGKPATYMLKLVAQKFSLKPKEIVFVGDNLETDIAMANRFGSFSVLVEVPQSLRVKGVLVKPNIKISSLSGLKKILRLV